MNPYKALEAIEVLVGGDFGLDMESILYEKRKKIDPKLKEAARLIGKIYQIAHSEGKCRHEDWERLKYEVLKESL